MFGAEILVAVALTFLVAGFVKGVIGLGLPTVTLALLALPLGLETTLAVLMVPMVVTNIWQALDGPHLRDILHRFWPYLLAAIIGVWAGLQVLVWAESNLLLALLGVVLSVNSVLSFTRFKVPAPRAETERRWSVFCGASGGVMFGMTGNFIVPGVMFLQALEVNRHYLVQLLGVALGTISAAMAVGMGGYNLIGGDVLLVSVAGLAPVFLGMWLGARFRHAVPEPVFRKLFYTGLLLAGVWMTYNAVMNLMEG